jgi:hypothetical protein
MALDHLGVIAARIRTSVLKVQRDPPSKKGLRPLDDVGFLLLHRVRRLTQRLADRVRRKLEVLEQVFGCPSERCLSSVQTLVRRSSLRCT